MTRDAQGFTLIELLAALVAGSLLVALLSWSIANLGRALNRGEDVAALAELEQAENLLSNLLTQIAPPEGSISSFTSTDTTLQAIVPPPAAIAAAGPMQLDLRVGALGGRQALFLKLSPVTPGTTYPINRDAERAILKGFDSIRLETVAAADDLKPLLPRLITIIARKRKAEHRAAFIPRLNATGGCTFDPISLECRR